MGIGITDKASMFLDERHERVERHLSELGLFPRRLSAKEICGNYPEVCEVVAGWRIELCESTEVDVLLDANYPYQRAMIGIAGVAHSCSRANVYTDGTLCLLTPHEAYSLADNENVLDELLTRTRSVLKDEPIDQSQRNAEEIVDYWKGGDGPGRLLLVDEIAQTPHEIFFSKAGPFTAISDSEARLRAWVSRYTGRTPNVERSALVTAAVDFPTTIVNAKALYDYFASAQPAQIALLESVAAGARPNIPLLIAIAGTRDGTAFLGCWIQKPSARQIGSPKDIPGFRKGTVPGHVAAPYIFSSQAIVTRTRVDRANVAWLTARGGSGSTSSIISARITLIGCGSLGSSVARLLVKAGVSHLRVVDPQILEWDNIARHELGGDHVGQSKAKALAAALTRDFPHLEIEASQEPWQSVFRNDRTWLEQADVVVSTTGDPASDIQLDDTLRGLGKRPITIFTWLEPYAAAAQALVLAGDGCLRCGCDDLGTFLFAVTDWEAETQRHEPGCSRSWQPYSELDALPAKAFVAATVLQTIETKPAASTLWSWVGADKVRAVHGGKLRDSWLALHAGAAQAAVYEDEWLPRCDRCRRAA